MPVPGEFVVRWFRVIILVCSYASPGDGVSRACSTARESRKVHSIDVVIGCVPPSTRRAIRSVFSSVATASRRSSSVAPSSL